MARGVPGIEALDMSKFFDTNYHYLVPELTSTVSPKPDFGILLDKVKRGQATIGKEKAVPIIIGAVLSPECELSCIQALPCVPGMQARSRIPCIGSLSDVAPSELGCRMLCASFPDRGIFHCMSICGCELALTGGLMRMCRPQHPGRPGQAC